MLGLTYCLTNSLTYNFFDVRSQLYVEGQKRPLEGGQIKEKAVKAYSFCRSICEGFHMHLWRLTEACEKTYRSICDGLHLHL